ncbi:MAG: hypothetical protein QMA93_04360 [Acidimicrobiales bacterium]|mgnify:FL=1|jgi:hypothetical protein
MSSSGTGSRSTVGVAVTVTVGLGAGPGVAADSVGERTVVADGATGGTDTTVPGVTDRSGGAVDAGVVGSAIA